MRFLRVSLILYVTLVLGSQIVTRLWGGYWLSWVEVSIAAAPAALLQSMVFCGLIARTGRGRSRNQEAD